MMDRKWLEVYSNTGDYLLDVSSLPHGLYFRGF